MYKVWQIKMHTSKHTLWPVWLWFGCASEHEAHDWIYLELIRGGVQWLRSVLEAELKWRGCSWRASLLKGSCNFHSRVLFKLVLRPSPHRNNFLCCHFCPSCPVTPKLPCSLCSYSHLSPPSVLTSTVQSDLEGYSSLLVYLCEFWSSKQFIFSK